MPEDIESSSLNVKCFCSPGVEYKSRSRGIELSFVRNSNATLKDNNGQNLSDLFTSRSINKIKFSLRFLLINNERLKIIGGLIYRPEQFRFGNIGSEFSNVFLKIYNFSIITIKNRTYSKSGINLIIDWFNNDSLKATTL
jgi:hypothetical protein